MGKIFFRGVRIEGWVKGGREDGAEGAEGIFYP